MSAAVFAATAVALYAGHHVGDYWVQRDEDARHKGDPGWLGCGHCLLHVVTYPCTQIATLSLAAVTLGMQLSPIGITLGLLVSGVTHYVADRREPLKRIATLLPGKARFMELGVPRTPALIEIDRRMGVEIVCTDAPQLATGLWALDQSWHIFWGVFVAALIMAGLS